MSDKTTIDPADIAECIFYHAMDLPGIGYVHGPWDLRGDFARYTGNIDFGGRSVLDVGTASGFLSFSAEQAGASRVVSFDMDTAHRQTLQPFVESVYYTDHDRWLVEQTAYIKRWQNGYHLAHRALQSNAVAVYGDVYAMPKSLGTFDIVLVCALLEHLSDPIKALASIARRTADIMVLGAYIPAPIEEPMAWYLGVSSNPVTASVHWAYSLPVYREVLTMLGFEIESVTNGMFKEQAGPSPRTTIIARRKAKLTPA